MISPRALALALNGLLKNPYADLSDAPFNDIVMDSRKVKPGDLFVALRGEHTDGHKFLDDAVQRGATGLLTRAAPPTLPASVTAFLVDDTLHALQEAARQWRVTLPAKVVGITGSVGKTTVREALSQVLGRRYATFESPRNFNSEIGLPLALLGLSPQHEWAVMELGPYDLQEMQLLCDIARPDVGVVTNVGPTHLERYGSLDAIEEAKGTLPASLGPNGLAVLNADDERTLRMRRRTQARVLTFGLGRTADVRAGDVLEHGLDGLTFTLHLHKEAVAVRTPLAGAHHVITALAAATVAAGAGFNATEIAEALATLRTGSRLKPRRSFSGALILDDTYNAAPLSMKAALDFLAQIPGRRVAVLGDMLELGSEEEAGHREVGAYAVGRCDRIVAVGERARTIANGAWDAGHTQIQWFQDKESATATLRQEVGADDVVLIKASHGLALETVVEALVNP